jgi:hypothetical protein
LEALVLLRNQRCVCRYFISGLLVHLDDNDKEVRQAVMQPLVELAHKKPHILELEIKKVYEGFRAKELLSKLLGICNSSMVCRTAGKQDG